jgi:hypothetical protein
MPWLTLTLTLLLLLLLLARVAQALWEMVFARPRS